MNNMHCIYGIYARYIMQFMHKLYLNKKHACIQ